MIDPKMKPKPEGALWPVLQIFVQKYKKFTQESGQILVKSTKGTKIAHNALEKIILPYPVVAHI